MKEIDKASFGELSDLAAKLEQMLTCVDEASGKKVDILVPLTGREIELLAESIAESAARAFRESR